MGRAQFQADFTMILIQLLTGHYLGWFSDFGLIFLPCRDTCLANPKQFV